MSLYYTKTREQIVKTIQIPGVHTKKIPPSSLPGGGGGWKALAESRGRERGKYERKGIIK
jgi:hypothetical protein